MATAREKHVVVGMGMYGGMYRASFLSASRVLHGGTGTRLQAVRCRQDRGGRRRGRRRESHGHENGKTTRNAVVVIDATEWKKNR